MKWGRVGIYLISLGVGSVILFVSITRAGLEKTIEENRGEELRKIPVEVEISTSSGETLIRVYRMPQVNVLPSSLAYPLKEYRDFLWLKLCTNPLQKSRVALLIADKRMNEAKMLLDRGMAGVAIDAGRKAVESLKYAESLIEGGVGVPEENQQGVKIREAGEAYEAILTKYQIEDKDYLALINEICAFNAQQKEEKTN